MGGLTISGSSVSPSTSLQGIASVVTSPCWTVCDASAQTGAEVSRLNTPSTGLLMLVTYMLRASGESVTPYMPLRTVAVAHSAGGGAATTHPRVPGLGVSTPLAARVDSTRPEPEPDAATYASSPSGVIVIPAAEVRPRPARHPASAVWARQPADPARRVIAPLALRSKRTTFEDALEVT